MTDTYLSPPGDYDMQDNSHMINWGRYPEHLYCDSLDCI